MAGGISYGKEYGLVLGRRFLKRLRAPRVPVHGVMGVLEKVGGFFVDQLVRRFLR